MGDGNVYGTVGYLTISFSEFSFSLFEEWDALIDLSASKNQLSSDDQMLVYTPIASLNNYFGPVLDWRYM